MSIFKFISSVGNRRKVAVIAALICGFAISPAYAKFDLNNTKIEDLFRRKKDSKAEEKQEDKSTKSEKTSKRIVRTEEDEEGSDKKQKGIIPIGGSFYKKVKEKFETIFKTKSGEDLDTNWFEALAMQFNEAMSKSTDKTLLQFSSVMKSDDLKSFELLLQKTLKSLIMRLVPQIVEGILSGNIADIGVVVTELMSEAVRTIILSE